MTVRRLTTREVCALGRFSRATMWRRVQSGALPAPIDHARQALFDAEAVERALSIVTAKAPAEASKAAVAERMAQLERRWQARQARRNQMALPAIHSASDAD